MRQRNFVRLLVLAGVIYSGAVAAADFGSTYFFGDSLTDSGSYIIAQNSGSPPFLTTGRFTIDPGKVWAQDLAAHYGASASPYGLYDPTGASGSDAVVVLGGTDYALGGARVSQTPGVGIAVAKPVSDQVGLYLGTVGKADPNALYTVWAGANDVFAQAATVGITATPQTAGQNVAIAAGQEVALLQQLHDAGARYILVPNLPDIGRTPGAIAEGPQAQVLSSQLSSTFNDALAAGIESAGLEIIPVDVHSLFDEVLSDPQAYGFDNVTQPACTTSSALTCNTSTVATDQRYFFADGVHPTPRAHAILAQYAESILDAPGEISLLPDVAYRDGLSQADNLDRHLSLTRNDERGGGVNVFITGTANDVRFGADSGAGELDTNNHDLLAGVELPVHDHAIFGLAFGYTDGDPSFGGNAGGSDFTDKLLMAYAEASFHHAYINLVGGIGFLDYGQVERRIHLGPATRSESGDTNGRQQLLRFSTGYNFTFSHLKTGPVAALTYQRVHVNGYRESGMNSTSMHFSDQNLYSLLGSVGWQVRGDSGITAIGRLQPFISATYNQEFKNDDRTVGAGLNTFGGDFSMPAYQPDRYYTQVGLGVDDTFASGLTASLNLSTAIGLQGGRSNAVALGLTQHF